MGTMSTQRPYPAGIDLVEQDKCPRGLGMAMGCMLCAYGHMTECHYPMDCEEADCEHFRAQKEHHEEDTLP
jgi:hypothetical protein